ncbi:MAG: oligosaccharide flippase family protein [Acaryochloridaceae cyanobacterium SU_2_1]|nr:oligosaccharide flippase family protein [Acaryochloridaceae cyanobacterium SU_2_1]
MLFKLLQQKFSSQLVRNMGWMGAAEFANRIFRLATTVTLARVFSKYDFGLAAIIFTCFDIGHVFTVKNGLTEKIIQADTQDLATICNTTYWLSWALGGLVASFQCAAAFALAYFYQDAQLVLPLCAMAVVFLIMPGYKIQYSLIVRENRLKVIALCNAVQSLLANIITVIFALLGMGVWAVVWPIILTTPVWLFICLLNHRWQPPKQFDLKGWKGIALFAKNLLGVEILAKVVGNLDYFLIGRFIGLEALGVYFFAFNAGLGISLNVMDKFLVALFPHLCEARTNAVLFRKRYFHALRTLAIFFVPLILCQVFLLPIYVPIVFGKQWIASIPIISLVCLSALPRPFWLGSVMLLDATDQTNISFRLNVIFTLIFAIAISVSVHHGLIWVATSVLLTHCTFLPVFTIWCSRHVLSKIGNSEAINT